MARTLDLRPLAALAALTTTLSACATPANDGVDETTSAETGDPETGAPETETGAPETDTETETGTDTEGDPPRPERLVVTADWRAKRLSLLDYAALRDGATTRDEALWKTIELPEHEPGPMEVELTPDGSLAVVAVSPGFFGGAVGALVDIPPGSLPEGGGLLIVDVDSGAIVAELDTAHVPLGIAISPDGKTAWTANYGGNGESGTSLSQIDLETLSIAAEFEVGPGPEQLDLSADGSLGMFNLAGDGTVVLFDPADPAGTFSNPAEVSDDPSWVLILDDGMDRAVSINSLGPSGYSLLDIADPQNPVVLDTITTSGVAYAAQPGRTPNEILLSLYVGDTASLQMFDVDTGEIVDQFDLALSGFAMGLAFEPDDEIALVPMPGANVLVVADFATGEHREIAWQDEVGPTYVTLE